MKPNPPRRAASKALTTVPAKRRNLQQVGNDARALVTLKHVQPQREARDRDFLPAALAILEAPPSPKRVAFLYTICAMIAAAIAWSYFGHLDVFASAAGKVQATGRTKVIQPLVSGTVIAVRVKSGDRVKKGDVLVELDPSEAISDRNIAADKLNSATAQIARFRAEVGAVGESINTRPVVKWDASVPQIVRQREEGALRSDLAALAANIANLKAQLKEKEADRDKYTSGIAAQNAIIAVIKEQLAMNKTLADKGWNSRATYLAALLTLRQSELALATLAGSRDDAIAAIRVVESEIAKTRETFISTNTQLFVDQERQREDLIEQLAKANTKIKYLTLVAPTAGTIQALSLTTIGQVVTTGQQLMQLVPDGAPLEIEAYVSNSDIGFVRKGQEAVVKVDTFPFTRYGTLTGVVTNIANDAVPSSEAQQMLKNGSQPTSSKSPNSATSAVQQTQDLVFPVTVTVADPNLNINGKKIPLSFGMTVTCEIKTESRRAIDYILSPLQATLSSAAQER